MHLNTGGWGGTVPQTTITQNEISICSEVLENEREEGGTETVGEDEEKETEDEGK